MDNGGESKKREWSCSDLLVIFMKQFFDTPQYFREKHEMFKNSLFAY
jgi:hypothetical protein